MKTAFSIKRQWLAVIFFIAVLIVAAAALTPRYLRQGNPSGFVSGATPAVAVYGKVSGKKVVLTKLGMYCSSCREAIAAALLRLNGVNGFKIDVQKDYLLVGYDPAQTDLNKVKQVIVDAGYKVGGVRRL